MMNSGEEGGQALLRVQLAKGRLHPQHVGPVGQDQLAQCLPVPKVSCWIHQLTSATTFTQGGIDPGEE
jgi:hypothetical protein